MMPERQLNALTLLGLLIAGALLGRGFAGPLAWVPTLTGILLLIVLFAFDAEGYRAVWQSVAFAGVGGYCIMLASTGILHLFGVDETGYTGFVPVGRTAQVTMVHGEHLYWPPLIWLAGTILVLIIDRARMTARAPRSILPNAITTAAHQPRSVAEEPLAKERIVQPDSPVEPLPNAVPLPLGAGKPATVYLNLVNEGLACMRPVGAEHLGRNYYRIVEPIPEGESWEFQPGQIVRCEKRKLSTGKALVAVEEAPRAS